MDKIGPLWLGYTLRSGIATSASLSLLYLGLSERLGLGLCAVVKPGHMFVRSCAPDAEISFETTRGKVTSKRRMLAEGSQGSSSYYLQSLRRRELLAHLLGVKLAVSLLGEGRVDEALSCCERGLQLNSTMPDAWGVRAYLNDMRGEFECAVSDIDTALRLFPSSADDWALRGSTLFSLGRFEESGASSERALALDPNTALASRIQKGVRTILSGALPIPAPYPCPAQLDARRDAIHISSLYVRGKLQQGLDLARRSSKRHPESMFILWTAVAGGMMRHQYSAALADCALLVRLAPDTAQGWQLQGRLLALLAKHLEAVESFNRALEIVPNDARTLVWKAAALAAEGREPESRGAMRSAKDADRASAMDEVRQLPASLRIAWMDAERDSGVGHQQQ